MAGVASALWWTGGSRTQVRPARRGIVRAVGGVMTDDDGPFHPLGCTFFWAMQGWRGERAKTIAHLDYLSAHGIDDVRILGEVDWPGREIDPDWSDYEAVLGGFIDAAYDRGLRTQITLGGGISTARSRLLRVRERVTAVVRDGRAEKVLGFEICNEYRRGPKATLAELETVCRDLRADFPDHLIALSTPSPEQGAIADMQAAMQRAGATLFWLHPRRSTHDAGWSNARQGYDFRHAAGAACNGEPQGPQSSVASEMRPLLLAMARGVTILCGAARYVFHPGQMVTGRADPAYGRPDNLWDVPDIAACLAAVRGVDALVPAGVENWKVANNARDDHPLPLNPLTSTHADDGPAYREAGFWEGDGRYGRVNKNYAALAPDGSAFAVALLGVKAPADGEYVPIGTALRDCVVDAFDPITQSRVEHAELHAGQTWELPGRRDTQAGYLVQGTYR